MTCNLTERRMVVITYSRVSLSRAAIVLIAFILLLLCFTFSSCGTFVADTPPREKITVYLDPAGGAMEDGAEKIVFYSDEAPTLPTAVREGYYFSGWDKEASQLSDGDRLTAIWDRRYVTVRFDADGGELSDTAAAVQQVEYGELPVIPTPRRDGYDFIGWDKEVSSSTEDVKYTALWRMVLLSEDEIYASALPSTVEIRIYDKTDIELSFGSGFFISDDGDIATAAHVIEGAARIKVKLSDGRELTVREVVSCNFETDIAVIKVSGKNLPPPLELSRDTADIGDVVYAIGSPGGRRGEMTAGEITRLSYIYDRSGLLVFSAPIEGGSSGGPLLDGRGRAIGVNIAVSALAEEYLAVRVSELDKLTPENLSIEEYAEKYGNQGNAKPEAEPNDNADLAQKVNDGEVVRGALSADSDRDVYLCSDTENVLFVVAVKAEDSVKLVAEGHSSDENAKVKVNMIYGSNGDYAHVHVSVVSASPSDAYLTVRANGDKDIPIIYSVHTVEK